MILEIDSAGWIAGSTSAPGVLAAWLNVVADRMIVRADELPADFPALVDVAAVRLWFGNREPARQQALISCDVIMLGSVAAVRSVSKGGAGRGYAMLYTASLFVPCASRLIELSIQGDEKGMTGVRESVLLYDLMLSATPEQSAQVHEGKIAAEWKFERYEPERPQGQFAYLLGDDEVHDVRFPNHPLSSVRRLLRRQEKSFRLVNDGSSEIQVRPLPLQPMTLEAIQRELGPQIAADAAMMEALKRTAGVEIPSFAVRQKACIDRVNQETKEFAEQWQERTRRLKTVTEETRKAAATLSPDNTYVWLAQLRRHKIPFLRSPARWFSVTATGKRPALAVFTSLAFIEDFIGAKELLCDPVRISLTELFGKFGELAGDGMVAIELNHCPRCTEARQAFDLSGLKEASALVAAYAAAIVARGDCVETGLAEAAAEADRAKRMAKLQYLLDHIDPGSAAVHLEVARLAAAQGDSILVERSRRALEKHAPERLGEMPVY